jgi:hypothetical protein
MLEQLSLLHGPAYKVVTVVNLPLQKTRRCSMSVARISIVQIARTTAFRLSVLTQRTYIAVEYAQTVICSTACG